MLQENFKGEKSDICNRVPSIYRMSSWGMEWSRSTFYSDGEVPSQKKLSSYSEELM